MRECLAAGPLGLVQRDALIARIGCAIKGSTRRESTIDLPPEILVGAVFRFLSMHLSDSVVGEGVRGEVREWAGRSHGDPRGSH